MCITPLLVLPVRILSSPSFSATSISYKSSEMLAIWPLFWFCYFYGACTETPISELPATILTTPLMSVITVVLNDIDIKGRKLLKTKKLTVYAPYHVTYRYRGQELLHIWNLRPQFAYSLWHFYGAPMKNKECFLLRLLMLKAKSREKFPSPATKVRNFGGFRGLGSGSWQGLIFKFDFHCKKHIYTRINRPGRLSHCEWKLDGRCDLQKSQLIRLSPNLVWEQISKA